MANTTCPHTGQIEAVTPVVQSFEPGEDWLWCYINETYAE